MMVPVSDFVWRLFPTLQIIQFPWRFGSVLSLAAAMLTCIALDSVRRAHLRGVGYSLYWMFTAMLACLVYTGASMFLFVASAERDRMPTTRDTMDVPEYLPRWARQPLWETVKSIRKTPATIETECGTTNGVAWVDVGTKRGDPFIAARFVEGNGDLSIRKWQTRHLVLDTLSGRSSVLHVSQLYFPGWIARSDGRELPLHPSVPEGLLEIEVPPGRRRIEITLDALWAERLGNCVGCASGGMGIVGICWLLIRRRAEPDRMASPNQAEA
jgi:hypothetical protein